MIAELAVLLAAFAGNTLIDGLGRKRRRLKKKTRKARYGGSADSRSQTIIDAPEKIYDRYFKVSLVSMGLAMLAPFAFSLYLLSLAAVVYTSLPVLRFGSRQLLVRRTIGHDVLYALYVLLAFATRQQALLTISMFFYHAGLKLFAKNQEQSEPIISSIFKQQPAKVWVVKDGAEIETNLLQVQRDDIISLKTGEVAAIDGRIVEGMASIDQHALTGESQPVEKGIGDQVFASTMLVTGRIKVRVERAGHETTIRNIAEILNSTAAYSTLIQLKGERWSNLVAVPMVTLTALAIPTLGLLGAASVAHSGFGNRVRVAAPLGTLNYLHLAFSNGLLVKDGRALEELKKVDTVVFDKTGTLTKEQPEVGQVIVFDALFEQRDVLAYAAAAESRLAHPLAAAIVGKAEELNIGVPRIDDSKYEIGYGITLDLGDRVIRVGSVRFLNMQGISLSSDMEAAVEQARGDGHSLVMVAVDNRVVGAVEIQSALRPEVKSIIRGLRARGVEHIAIVSGDHQHTTQVVAESLGVDSYSYEVLPEQKADIVTELQREGRKVCFVGDGINDAIAMKAANVSVSLRGATSIATDTAQIVLMDGTLTRLCELFDLAKELQTNLLRGLGIIGIPSVFNISGVFLFGFRMVASTLIVNASFLFAMANAMYPWFLRHRSERAARKHERP